MKVEVNFKMKHILKRNVDSLHHLHLNHRNSRRRQQRQYHHHQQQQQQQSLQSSPSSTNSNHLQSNPFQRNVDQLLTVKRALFVDSNLFDNHHRQTSELLRAEMDKIEEEQCARYNFDFKNELPLEGNYQWIKMTTTTESSSQPTLTTTTTSTTTNISTSSSTTTTTTTTTSTASTCKSSSSPSSPPVEISNGNQNLPDECKVENSNEKVAVVVVMDKSK